MPLEPLSAKETEFLRSLLKDHLAYYSILAANSDASLYTKSRFAFISALWQKLEPGHEHDPHPASQPPGAQPSDLFGG